MEFSIVVDETKVAEHLENLIAEEMVSKHGPLMREAKAGIREGMEKAVKAHIYSQKEEIIEKVIERATAEIVRKGLPKLIEKLTDEK